MKPKRQNQAVPTIIRDLVEILAQWKMKLKPKRQNQAVPTIIRDLVEILARQA
ncbi:hypothetical protein DPMN_054579 [Dreissena polymorpha]|uniref:Uncharacterized protein n=1 Tax=Dreissena polymorpha TaxID=45954 RepID=A0A9D4HRR7_DREPO|nr:hypothetical protein DPMN_054579 [Dreissena polymorpha]